VWDAKKSALGYSRYTRAQANAISPQDRIYIAVSYILKKDMRNLFYTWGIIISDTATAQVDTFSFSKLAPQFWYRTVNAFGGQMRVFPFVGSVPIDGSVTTLPKVPYTVIFPKDNLRSVPVRKPVSLTVNVGTDTGTITFKVNGENIYGCTNVSIVPDVSYTYYSAKCDWVPQTAGSYAISAIVNNLKSGYQNTSTKSISISVIDSTEGPRINALSISSSLVGSRIQINGSKLSNVNRIKFNGQDVQFTADSDQQLSLTIPSISVDSLADSFTVYTQDGYVLYSPNFTAKKTTVSITSVAISTKAMNLNRGQRLTFSVTTAPSVSYQPTFTWASSNSNIFTVSNQVLLLSEIT
jgi:hypothetical protein